MLEGVEIGKELEALIRQLIKPQAPVVRPRRPQYGWQGRPPPESSSWRNSTE